MSIAQIAYRMLAFVGASLSQSPTDRQGGALYPESQRRRARAVSVAATIANRKSTAEFTLAVFRGAFVALAFALFAAWMTGGH